MPVSRATGSTVGSGGTGRLGNVGNGGPGPQLSERLPAGCGFQRLSVCRTVCAPHGNRRRTPPVKRLNETGPCRAPAVQDPRMPASRRGIQGSPNPKRGSGGRSARPAPWEASRSSRPERPGTAGSPRGIAPADTLRSEPEFHVGRRRPGAAGLHVRRPRRSRRLPGGGAVGCP